MENEHEVAVAPVHSAAYRAAMTALQRFRRLTPAEAARWAISQPEAGGRRARATAWARAYLAAARNVRSAVEARLLPPSASGATSTTA